MKKENFLIKCYNKIQNFLSLRNITWITVFAFIVLLLPILYLSFVNRASGDDYGYGTYTRTAFFATHSIIEVMKAIWKTIKQYYYGWQGTWFSIALFALQPEVFSDKAYVITTFLMLFLWIGSTIALFKEILIRQLKLKKWNFWLITLFFLIIAMQFVPSTKSSIFWYNGCAHYLVPFAMGQFLVYLLLRFADTYKVRYYIWICIFMALLGGSNYQAALFALIVAVYVGVTNYIKRKDNKVFTLLLPILIEIVGLVISITAPGNKVRGGEEFGFSFSKAAETIGVSFVKGVTDIGNYLTEKSMVFIGLFALFLILLEVFGQREERGRITYPVVRALALFCLYSAMQAPEIYAAVEVSSGVYNMNYWTFLLMAIGILLIIAETVAAKIEMNAEKIHKCLVIPGFVICLCLAFMSKTTIKDSTAYVCLRYIISGEAADYKEQMDLQTKLLTGDKQDVVLPFINDIQGPLMHMPVTDNPDAWTNHVTRDFYGKESVVAMPRPEWNKLYGDA